MDCELLIRLLSGESVLNVVHEMSEVLKTIVRVNRIRIIRLKPICRLTVELSRAKCSRGPPGVVDW